PGGHGVRVFCRGTLPPGGRRKGKVEVYSDGRFLTVTGHALPGSPAAVEDRAGEVAALHAELFGQPKAPAPPRPAPAPLGLAAHQMVERASRAVNGPKFTSLWAGSTAGYDSASEADLALVDLLAFWTGPDPGRIDRLFRASGLMREKWQRPDYRDRTIA